MNRSGNTGFNGLVFFGNRGDGLFFWRGVRESWYLLFLRATSQADMLACPFGRLPQGVFDRSVCAGFEPKVSNRARQIRIKDSRIPLNAVAARKEKVGQECWCGDGLV